VRRRIWKRGKNEDSGERGEDKKRGKKMPFKSRRKNRKIRRKEKIQSGIACGLMITEKKKATKTNPLGDVQNKTPKKKIKKLFFQHKTPSPKYIYIVDLSQSMEKKFTISTPPPVHFLK
jgi:hypothetical protein